MTKGRLQDKVSIVTGGSRGIGAATAQRFVEEGTKAAIFGRLNAEEPQFANKPGSGVGYDNIDITKVARCSRNCAPNLRQTLTRPIL